MGSKDGWCRSAISVAILLGIEMLLVFVYSLLFSLINDKWNYKQASVYVINMLSTVGYEGVGGACKSDDNFCMVMTVLLGFFGISFTIITVALMALNMTRVLELGDGYVKEWNWLRRALGVIIMMFVLFAIIVLLPSLVVCLAYDWDFIASIYFIFNTVTTAGMSADGQYSVHALLKEGYAVYYIMAAWCFVGLSVYLAGIRHMYYKLFARWCGETLDSAV